MTVDKLVKELDLEVLTQNSDLEKEIKGCYICDLLSLAMSKVQSQSVWITVQANVNIVAVAVLTEASCILIAEGMSIEQSVIDKATNEGVTILRTDKSAFDVSVSIGNML